MLNKVLWMRLMLRVSRNKRKVRLAWSVRQSACVFVCTLETTVLCRPESRKNTQVPAAPSSAIESEESTHSYSALTRGVAIVMRR